MVQQKCTSEMIVLTLIWSGLTPELIRLSITCLGSSQLRTRPKSNSSAVEYIPASETAKNTQTKVFQSLTNNNVDCSKTNNKKSVIDFNFIALVLIKSLHK